MVDGSRGEGSGERRRTADAYEALARRAASVVEHTRTGRFLVDTARAARAVVHGFRGEKISLRAAALTYITMLSLVPLLAVAFAIIRALGQDGLRRAVHDFVFVNLAPGAREQTVAYLDEFIARASGGTMGGLGGVLLLISAVTLLHNIEKSLNEIWGGLRPRTLVQRVLIYWCVLTLGPVALGTSLLATGAARAAVEGRAAIPSSVWALVPLGTTVFGLVFLYMVAPNARVRVRAALGGGLVAGSLWELAKHGYALYAAKSFRYSAIYGSLGAIPLFLLWVYLSWLLVLFGARLAYALQNAAGAPAEPVVEDPRGREVLCARVALAAAVEYLAGAPAPTALSIAGRIGVDEAYVREAIRQLLEGGLLAESADGAVVPARPPEEIRLIDIARVARGTLFSSSSQPPSSESETSRLAACFVQSDEAARDALSRANLADLARPLLARLERKANPAR